MNDQYVPDERWVDAHSVTCAICGALADERGTINLYEQENSRLEGEAHQDCWVEHMCVEDNRFAPTLDATSKIKMKAGGEVVLIPVVCKVCGQTAHTRHQINGVTFPNENIFYPSPTT
jgi:Fe-S oxidoreductase